MAVEPKDRMTSWVDQNYALRQAVHEAAQKMARAIYEWSPEKTERYYYELAEGNSKLSLDLVHPNIERSHEPMVYGVDYMGPLRGGH